MNVELKRYLLDKYINFIASETHIYLIDYWYFMCLCLYYLFTRIRISCLTPLSLCRVQSHVMNFNCERSFLSTFVLSEDYELWRKCSSPGVNNYCVTQRHVNLFIHILVPKDVNMKLGYQISTKHTTQSKQVIIV